MKGDLARALGLSLLSGVPHSSMSILRGPPASTTSGSRQALTQLGALALSVGPMTPELGLSDSPPSDHPG